MGHTHLDVPQSSPRRDTAAMIHRVHHITLQYDVTVRAKWLRFLYFKGYITCVFAEDIFKFLSHLTLIHLETRIGTTKMFGLGVDE